VAGAARDGGAGEAIPVKTHQEIKAKTPSEGPKNPSAEAHKFRKKNPHKQFVYKRQTTLFPRWEHRK
jgi:hypothetical protein